MHAEVTLTLLGEFPDGLQVGDELAVSGVVTVHTITAEMVDVSSAAGKAYLPATRTVGVYSNTIQFAGMREP